MWRPLLLSALLERAVSDEKSISFSQLERLGAELEIVNEPDFFGFQATILSGHLEQVLGTFLDWSRLSDLEATHLESARREVLALEAKRQESDLERLLQSAREAMFGEHPYGLPPFGTSETIAKISLEALENWRVAQIRQIHPLIVVRGDVEGTSFLRDFVSKLSDRDYQNREPVKKPFAGPESGYDSYADRVVAGSRGRWAMPFRGPVTGTKQKAALDVLEVALLGPTGSLSDSLRTQGWVHQLQILQEPALNSGAVLIHLASLGENEEAVRETLFNQLDQLGRVPLREQDFLRAVVGAITRFHLRQQAGERYLRELVHQVAVGRGVDSWERYLTTLRNLRREDVMSMASQFLREQEPGRKSPEPKPEESSEEPEAPKPAFRPPSLRRPR